MKIEIMNEVRYPYVVEVVIVLNDTNERWNWASKCCSKVRYHFNHRLGKKFYSFENILFALRFS